MARLDHIERDVHDLHRHLVRRVPTHFSALHVVSSFFGALTISLIFALKGLLFEIGLALSAYEMFLIIFTTLLVLSVEIYFIGYARVVDKSSRPFGQFWLKRLTAYYGIAVVSSGLIVLIYGLHQLVPVPFDVFRLVVAMSLPAALGASAADLLGQY